MNTSPTSPFIKWFADITIDDVPLVGGKSQAPSDYPEFGLFLVEQGIDRISLTPDTVLKARLAILEKEKSMGLHA